MLDTIAVALIALLAAGYLFWRLRPAAKGKDAPCGCGTCGCACGCTEVGCRDNPRLMVDEGKKMPDESGNC
jgi:hypothetical protein